MHGLLQVCKQKKASQKIKRKIRHVFEKLTRVIIKLDAPTGHLPCSRICEAISEEERCSVIQN
jgi:hypothetical protein